MAADPDILHKVRSLLAKAESTTFVDEAEALTAKAQQLMDRHAIDRAVLAATARSAHEVPDGRDVSLEPPYAKEKSLLLGAVARANRCQVVYSAHERVATVVGFPEDQETVELLFTSLLVQATSAMLESGDRSSARTRRYRQSFLVAFATRIGQRLTEADEKVVAEADADHGGAVLPVLADREQAVEEHLATLFPHVQRRRVVVRDATGWTHGTKAADRARLGREDAVSGRRLRLRRGG